MSLTLGNPFLCFENCSLSSLPPGDALPHACSPNSGASGHVSGLPRLRKWHRNHFVVICTLGFRIFMVNMGKGTDREQRESSWLNQLALSSLQKLRCRLRISLEVSLKAGEQLQLPMVTRRGPYGP